MISRTSVPQVFEVRWSSFINQSFVLINWAGKLHQALYTPTGWAIFSNDTMYTYWNSLVAASGISFPLASRSLSEPTSLMNRDETAPEPSLVFTFEAITCGDSIDQSDVTTKSVFDEFVRVCREVSTFCKFRIVTQDLYWHLSLSWSPVPSASPQVSPLACTCCRALRGSLECHIGNPDPCYWKQSVFAFCFSYDY